MNTQKLSRIIISVEFILLACSTVMAEEPAGYRFAEHSTNVIAGGNLKSGKSKVYSVDINAENAGVEFVLTIFRHRLVDIDMAIYSELPNRKKRQIPICESTGSGEQEICRVMRQGGSQKLWIELVALSGSSSTTYELALRRLFPPVMEGTQLTASDALPLEVGGNREATFVLPPIFAAETFNHIYEIPLSSSDGGESVTIDLLESQSNSLMDLTIYEENGQIVPAELAEYEQSVRTVNDYSGSRLFVVVSLSSRESIYEKPKYDLFILDKAQPIMVATKSGVPSRYTEIENRDYIVELKRGQLGVLDVIGCGPSPFLEAQLDDSVTILAAQENFQTGSASDAISAYIGRPINQSTVIIRGLLEPKSITIRARPEDIVANIFQRRRCTISVRTETEDNSGLKYIIPFRLSDAEFIELTGKGWDTGIDEGKDRKVFRLRRPDLSSHGTDTIRFEIFGQETTPVVLATTNEFGQVTQIGDSSGLTLIWPADAPSIYLVLFRNPYQSGFDEKRKIDLSMGTFFEYATR